jgi:ketosteroid isomerase-like protein
VSVRERNLENLERGLDAFSRGAFDEVIDTVHPEIEWHITFRLPDRPHAKDVYRGRKEVEELWAAFASVWDELTIALEEILYADDERVVARARFRGRGEGSGVEVDRLVFFAYRMRDDMLIYSRAFDDEASARRDLGVEAGGEERESGGEAG